MRWEKLDTHRNTKNEPWLRGSCWQLPYKCPLVEDILTQGLVTSSVGGIAFVQMDAPGVEGLAV